MTPKQEERLKELSKEAQRLSQPRKNIRLIVPNGKDFVWSNPIELSLLEEAEKAGYIAFISEDGIRVISNLPYITQD